MNVSKVELIIHPVRMRILQTLVGETLTTQEIAGQLPDVPKSSIYRHLKLLLQGDMIAVAEARLINGIQEKVYTLAQSPRLGPNEIAELTADDHLRYFSTYVMTLLHGFAAYLSRAEATDSLNLLADRVGYTEAYFYATDEELLALAAAMNEVITKLMQNHAGNGRRRYKFAVVTHPEAETGKKS